ncbi:ROK family transcriptional regulator [Neorhizobium lilium]|uniref:ROK family transcriptional regulator n=1 Tax=Neorhizobium lilium TaxID=2503024 RepID=A0A3S3VP00_9HYPH|nr:ROK family transcriptional regulator [Neorhizobium lilium]RWX80803.1 ROK family transcriptional regulator [Neorhizobium lilium]
MLAKSSSELVRQQNSALVLSVLRRHGRLAHTEICETTRLASATVSAITAELERSGIIERIEQQAISGRGRPRVQFSQRRNCGYVIVMTVSSDVIQYSLVDYAGTLLDRFVEPRREDTPVLFLASISAALERALSRSRIDRSQVLLVSISSKGLVHPSLPSLVWSPVFGARSVDFSNLLKPDWEASVVLNNETLLVATALSRRLGMSKGGTDLAALSLGHSIGLGVSRLASSGSPEIIAPNFGHMLHTANGALCRCGASGCIEAYAGLYAILRAAFEAPTDRIPSKFVPLSEIEKIASQARQGHRMARMAFRQAGIALGNGLSRLLSLYGSMPIFVTGPGTRHYDLLQDGLGEGLAQTAVARLEGIPSLTVVPDEPALVFEGHLIVAFSRVDQEVLHLTGRQRQAAS